jgi:hypothetical protein
VLRRPRAIAITLLALLAIWQIVTRSLVAYLADAMPQAALLVRPGDAVALVNLADKALNDPKASEPAAERGRIQRASRGDRIAAFTRRLTEAQDDPAPGQTAGPGASDGSDASASNIDEIRQMVETALIEDPLNTRGLRILGQLAAQGEDRDQAAKLMRLAARLSLHESAALFWVMSDSFEKKDIASALFYADALLRTRPQLDKHIVPMLARLAEDEEAGDGLKRLLAANPPWRARFFAGLPASIADARTPLDLLLSLKSTATPPTAAELRGYLNFLINRRLLELSYYAWLQFLPAEQLRNAGLLYNGSFEARTFGMPFDWVITPGTDVTVDIAPHPDEPGQRALFIEFGHGRIQFGGVTQVIMLAPGSYRLQGSFKGEIAGRRGLRWRISCLAGSALRLAETPMVVGLAQIWQDFEVEFAVPSAGCQAQQLRLEFDARSASERMASGYMWYDRLNISRVDPPS